MTNLFNIADHWLAGKFRSSGFCGLQEAGFPYMRPGFLLLFIAFLGWQLPGWFPFASYESDALSICTSCEATYRNGWDALGRNGYGYWMQPLTYILIIALKTLFPFAECDAIYSVLSWVAAIGIQFATVVLVWRLSGLNPCLSIIAMWLLPESYALAMYPNSTSLALFCFICSCLLLTYSGGVKMAIALFLLLTAPLLRLDVLQIYVVIPLLLWWKFGKSRKAAFFSLLIALATLAVTVSLFWFLGASVKHTLSEYGDWSQGLRRELNFIAQFGFFSVSGFIVLAIGLWRLFKQPNKLISLTVVFAILTVWVVNFRFGNASKHYADAYPFIILPMAFAVKWMSGIGSSAIKFNKTALRALLWLMVLLPMFIGIRPGGSWQFPHMLLNRFGTGWHLFDASLFHREFQFYLGSGQGAMTCDEFILTSGNMFYPFTVHNLKLEQEEINRGAVELLSLLKAEASAASRCVSGNGGNNASLVVVDEWENAVRYAWTDEITGSPWPGSKVGYVKFMRDISSADLISAIERERPDSQVCYILSWASISHRWQSHLSLLQERQKLSPVKETEFGMPYIYQFR